jgi:hypothetical protein
MYQCIPYTQAQGGYSTNVEFEEEIVVPSNEDEVQMIVFRDELKCIHTNTNCRVNRATTKSTKVHGAMVPGGEGNKP